MLDNSVPFVTNTFWQDVASEQANSILIFPGSRMLSAMMEIGSRCWLRNDNFGSIDEGISQMPKNTIRAGVMYIAGITFSTKLTHRAAVTYSTRVILINTEITLNTRIFG